MSTRVVGDLKTAVEWVIERYQPVDNEYLESPIFSLAGCEWRLKVKPLVSYQHQHRNELRRRDNPGVTVCLSRIDAEAIPRRVSFELSVFVAESTEIDSNVLNCGSVMKGTFSQNDSPCVLRSRFNNLQRLLASFTLIVKFRMESQSATPEENTSLNIRQNEHLTALSSDFKDLLTSERKCDVTVSVQGREFRAHRVVLSARSPVFRAMFEHDTAEEDTRVLTIPDCDRESFGDFLSFLYTGRTEGDMSLEAAYQLYRTADKYDVPQLRSLCIRCMAHKLTPEAFCEFVVMADRHRSDEELMSSAQNYFNNNFYEIFLTSEWSAMVNNNPSLVNELMKELALAGLEKNSATPSETSSPENRGILEIMRLD